MKSHEASWRFIEADEYSWIPKEARGYSITHGYSCTFMEAQGYPWRLMKTHKDS